MEYAEKNNPEAFSFMHHKDKFVRIPLITYNRLHTHRGG